MKKVKLGFAIILASALISMQSKYAAIKTIELNEAIKNGLVSIETNSLGGHSGACIELNLINKTSGDLNLQVKAGSVFNPDEEDMQTLITVQDQILALKKNQTVKKTINAFCCEMKDRSPKTGTKFTCGTTTNPKLQTLANHLNSNTYPESMYQTAVWCVSDNNSVADIYFQDQNASNQLREETCKITGQKNVWYTNKTNFSLDDRGYINREPVMVSGAITMTIDKPITFRTEIRRADHSLLLKLERETKIERIGKFDYEFSMKVRGWEKGKYFVVVLAGEKEIINQEFDV